jgi:hypothetical protein
MVQQTKLRSRRPSIMKMLTIVCGEKIEDEVLMLLDSFIVKGYTVIAHVGGSGETGVVSGRGAWTDRNKMYLIALDDQRITPLVEGVKELQIKLVQDHNGRQVPLRVFLQPCELIV